MEATEGGRVSRYSTEALADFSKNLMIVHGAGLGLLVSQVGSAMDHPAMFSFLTPPLLAVTVGFVLAAAAFNVANFDPPPDHWLTKEIAWLPSWLSASLMVVALFVGAGGYVKLAASSIASV